CQSRFEIEGLLARNQIYVHFQPCNTNLKHPPPFSLHAVSSRYTPFHHKMGSILHDNAHPTITDFNQLTPS
ncbi:MAG: hypothetical protein ACI37P_07765, partial [Eggerthellaceae bacterium]